VPVAGSTAGGRPKVPHARHPPPPSHPQPANTKRTTCSPIGLARHRGRPLRRFLAGQRAQPRRIRTRAPLPPLPARARYAAHRRSERAPRRTLHARRSYGCLTRCTTTTATTTTPDNDLSRRWLPVEQYDSGHKDARPPRCPSPHTNDSPSPAHGATNGLRGPRAGRACRARHACGEQGRVLLPVLQKPCFGGPPSAPFRSSGKGSACVPPQRE
jgi:hypothetical protein